MTGYFIFHLLLLESKISEFSNPMLEVINNNGINKFDGTNLGSGVYFVHARMLSQGKQVRGKCYSVSSPVTKTKI